MIVRGDQDRMGGVAQPVHRPLTTVVVEKRERNPISWTVSVSRLYTAGVY